MSSPAQVIGQIRQLGGTRSSEFLSRLFGELAEREFNPENDHVLLERLRRLYEGDYLVPADTRDGIGGGYGGGSGFNMIPSRGHGGACTDFCLVDGFSHRYDRQRRFFGGPFNHRDLIHLTCAYWFDCHPINVETLILFGFWPSYQRYTIGVRAAIDSYKRNHVGKQVYVVKIDEDGIELVYS